MKEEKVLSKEYTPQFWEGTKKEWAKCKIYSEKLKFWERNFNPYILNNSNEHLLSEKRFNGVELIEFSIYPNSTEEGKEYFHWRKNHLLSEWNKKFIDTIEKKKTNSQRKEFIESELERMENYLHPKNKYEGEATVRFQSDVRAGYDKAVKGEAIILDRTNSRYWNYLIQGATIYEFKHFLIEQQKESSNPPEGKKGTAKPKNKNLEWNAPKNVLGEIFFQLKKELKNPENGKPFIIGTDEMISEMLCNYFSNIESKETFISYLNPSKSYNNPKKFILKVSIEEVKN